MKRIMGSAVMFFIVLALCCSSRDSSSRRSSADPDEVRRLKYYHSVGRTMRNGDQSQKREAVMDMMGRMQSGQIPKDAAQDFRNLNKKYSR